MTNKGHLTIPIEAQDSPSIDAFGRWRVSEPQTLFDSKNLYNNPDTWEDAENQPLFYDNVQTVGYGTTSTSYNSNQASQTVSVNSIVTATRIRQTKMRFNYQPGKSQLILMTFNMSGRVDNITKREGIFDENNGIFLELSDDVYLVIRSKASGSVVDTKIAQSDWNLDTLDGSGESQHQLNLNKTQILLIDYEWLGVGRVRMGFVVDGKIIYAHQFLNSNNLDVVYMSTPNLPLRTELSNNGLGAATSITQICSSVISEGGSEDLGVIRYASTNGIHIDADTENTIYAIIGMRLKTEYIGATIKQLNAAIQLQTGSEKVEWIIKLNPTVAGTFTYVGETNSAVEIARGTATNTVTGGTDITGGFIESGGAQSGNSGSGGRTLDNAITLGAMIDGTRDTLLLCARPIGGSVDVDIEGSLNWRELV